MLAEKETKKKTRPKKLTPAEVARQKFNDGPLTVISGFVSAAPSIIVPALSAEEVAEALQLIHEAIAALDQLRREVEKHKAGRAGS
jgi:hypothetical protein